MRAVVIAEPGGPEVLAVREVPDPAPGPEEVLVDIVSTAVNRADVLQRKGLYPGPPMAHEIPGLEFAGRVAAAGERVRERSVGDPVMGITNGGGYASRIAVHERQAVAVPEALPLEDAGGSPKPSPPPGTPWSARAGSPRAGGRWSTPGRRGWAPPPSRSPRP